MKILIMMRMTRFMKKLQMSMKQVLRQLIRLTMTNTQSVTGRNLRGILLLTQKSRVEDLDEDDVKNIQYHRLDDTEDWRVVTIKEVLEMQSGERELPEDWSWPELEDLLKVACISSSIYLSIMSTLQLPKQPHG